MLIKGEGNMAEYVESTKYHTEPGFSYSAKLCAEQIANHLI